MTDGKDQWTTTIYTFNMCNCVFYYDIHRVNVDWMFDIFHRYFYYDCDLYVENNVENNRCCREKENWCFIECVLSFGIYGVYELFCVLGIPSAVIIDYQAISLKTIEINIENKE